MNMYVLISIKFFLGILATILQINVLGKYEFSANTPLNQYSKLCPWWHYRWCDLQQFDFHFDLFDYFVDLVFGGYYRKTFD